MSGTSQQQTVACHRPHASTRRRAKSHPATVSSQADHASDGSSIGPHADRCQCPLKEKIPTSSRAPWLPGPLTPTPYLARALPHSCPASSLSRLSPDPVQPPGSPVPDLYPLLDSLPCHLTHTGVYPVWPRIEEVCHARNACDSGHCLPSREEGS